MFLTFFLFFMIFPVLALQKIKKNTSHPQKFFKLFLQVDYIFPSISAKNLIKIQRIEFFRGGCDNSSMRYVSSWHSCNVSKTSLGGRCLAAHQQPRPWPGLPPVPPHTTSLVWGGALATGSHLGPTTVTGRSDGGQSGERPSGCLGAKKLKSGENSGRKCAFDVAYFR